MSWRIWRISLAAAGVGGWGATRGGRQRPPLVFVSTLTLGVVSRFLGYARNDIMGGWLGQEIVARWNSRP